MTSTRSVINYETAELALYHGSQVFLRGEWYLAGPCTCQRCIARALSGQDAGRYELADAYRTSLRITCVRRESFTLYSDLPQARPAPEHKTRTSQPNGYQYGADGSRMTDKRGRLMRDHGSWWFCACGAKGAGATREEARSRARGHREDEAAKHAAEFEAALSALRAKLAPPVPQEAREGRGAR